MKRLLFILLALCLSNCHKFPESPCDDEDLRHKPDIVRIELDADYNLVLYLDYGYSEKSNILLERKTKGGFERINYDRFSQAALLDTSFNKELDYSFIYRVSVEKSGCRSDYSNEKAFDYISKMLYAPAELHTTTLELQGIRLEWRDRSGKEDGYKIEKNDGSGWVELVSLPANTQNYLHAISGIPSLPLQLSYRVRAYNSNLASKWAEIATSYSGLAAPSNLRITDTTAWHFTIEWQDNSNIETRYSIERNKNGGAFKEIAQLSANTTRYPDTIIEIGIYGYRVRAKKENLYSLYSNEASHDVRNVVPVEGLVAYYPFNGNTNDESGKGNNGTVNGATLTTDRRGSANCAYNFNGTSSYISFSSVPTTNIDNWCISAWIRLNSLSQIGTVVLSGYDDGTTGDGYALCIGNTLPSYIGDKLISIFGGVLLLDSGYLFRNTSDWFNIIMQRKNGVTSFYVNGIIASNTFTTTPKIPTRFYIGSSTGIRYFNGKIDDVRIYNRALTGAEIQALYHEGGW